MTHHTIQISEAIYTLLLKQATRLQVTPDQVLERLVSNNFSAFDLETDNNDAINMSSGDLSQALAAVQRLSMLFADVAIPNFDQILSDPMFALANVDLFEPIG